MNDLHPLHPKPDSIVSTRQTSRRWLRRLPAAILLVAFGSVAMACNIPVFRYALERWQPDPCEIVVFHESPLTQTQQQQIDAWQKTSSPNGGHANVKVIVHSLSGVSASEETETRDLLRSLPENEGREFPHVVLRTRVGRGRTVNHWHGSLSQASKLPLLHSPVRNTLARRLSQGDSVVWLVLHRGGNQAGRRAIERIETTLRSLADRIELPDGVGQPGSELHSEIPLLVKFSLLTIDSRDADEQYLVDLLRGFYPESVAQGEPLVVPVFGRGRALEVLPAEMLDDRLIEDLTLFLSGACSCQVKEQNPGFDLLISADWDTELFGEDGTPPPALPSGTRAQNKTPQLLTIPPGNRR